MSNDIPKNPLTGKPYFTISDDAWGGEWKIPRMGNVHYFSTRGATRPLFAEPTISDEEKKLLEELLIFNFLKEDKNPDIQLEDLKLGSKWIHNNGNEYEIIAIANTYSQKEEYPITIIYKGDNGRVWSRQMIDWSRSFRKKPE